MMGVEVGMARGLCGFVGWVDDLMQEKNEEGHVRILKFVQKEVYANLVRIY